LQSSLWFEEVEMGLIPDFKQIATRSPWIYRINAGSCNGCDVEMATTALIPRYDIERLGCQYCGSPKHADIVLISGPLTVRVKDAVLRMYEEIPDPKVTVAVGVCPISGGIFRESYAVLAPIDQYIPIDVNVPGCPPRPQAIIAGVAKAIAIWRERL
jgi:Ni,Fe-hydrogenase III small subunit